MQNHWTAKIKQATHKVRDIRPSRWESFLYAYLMFYRLEKFKLYKNLWNMHKALWSIKNVFIDTISL